MQAPLRDYFLFSFGSAKYQEELASNCMKTFSLQNNTHTMVLGILNYRRRNFVVGTAETRKDPTSRVGHGNSNNVMDIENFLLIRNFRLAGNGDSFFVAISHERNYPNSGYRSERKGKKFKNPAISWRHTGI